MYAVTRFITESSCSVRGSQMLRKRWITGEREREPTEQYRTGANGVRYNSSQCWPYQSKLHVHWCSSWCCRGYKCLNHLSLLLVVYHVVLWRICYFFSHIFICILCVELATFFNYLFKGSPKKFIFIIIRRVSIQFVILDVCSIQ